MEQVAAEQQFMVQVALHKAQVVIMNAPSGAIHDIVIEKAIDSLVVELDNIGLKKPLAFIIDRLNSSEAIGLPEEKLEAMKKATSNLKGLFIAMSVSETAEQSRAALRKKGFNV